MATLFVFSLLTLATTHARLFCPPDDRTIIGPGGRYGIYTIVSEGCLLCLGPFTVEVPVSADQLQWTLVGLICVIPVTAALSLWLLRQLGSHGLPRWLVRTSGRAISATGIVLLGALLSYTLYRASHEWLYTDPTIPAIVCAVITLLCFSHFRFWHKSSPFPATIVWVSSTSVLLVLLLLTGITIAYALGEQRRVVMDIPICLVTGLPRVLPFFIFLLVAISVGTKKRTILASPSL